MTHNEFQHEVLFYGGRDEFLAGAVPYLRAAIEAGEPALVAVDAEHTRALRRELGADAGAVRFAPMAEVGRNPARIIPFWREFVEAHCGPGRPVHGIGEPIWASRTAHELDECQRHECLLNLAFEGMPPWSLLCPYDAEALPDEVLAAAERCHPFSLREGEIEPNVGCNGQGREAILGGAFSPPPQRAATLEFDRAGLAGMRALVGAEAELAGLGQERLYDTVTAASELAANSIVHGGGRGTIRVWTDRADLVVEVGDAGLIEDPLVGRCKPLPTQNSGRGLWIANMLCDLVQIRSDGQGTTVRLRMRLE